MSSLLKFAYAVLPFANFKTKLTLFDHLNQAGHQFNLRIALDMDDTLVDSFPEFCKVIRKLKPDVGEILVRESHNLLGITLQEWFDYMNETQILHNLPVKGKALEVIASLVALKNLNTRIEIFTSRGFYNDAHNATTDWLHRNGIVPHAVHIIPFGKSKADYMLENNIEPFHFFFDDVLKDCVDCVQKGVALHSVVINMPWNEDEYIKDTKYISRLDCVGEFILIDHLEIFL